MTTSLAFPSVHGLSSIKSQIDREIDDMIASLPDPKEFSSEQRRGIIARYTAVLEGNFIYWMTTAFLSAQSEEARPIIIDNLREEVGECHPEMLRRFAIAARAFPKDTDALAVRDNLAKVRLFLGRLSGVHNVLLMAFFETYIQRYMSYLADLAVAQGSSNLEYTDVHGVCDVGHSEGLLLALSSEIALSPLESGADPFEGVNLLRALIQDINGTDQEKMLCEFRDEAK